MTFDVIDQLLQTVFADYIILDTSRSRLPLEIIQAVKMIISLFPTRMDNLTTIRGVKLSLQTTTLFQYSTDKLGVVACLDAILVWSRLILLVSILGDVRVLGEGLFPCL